MAALRIPGRDLSHPQRRRQSRHGLTLQRLWLLSIYSKGASRITHLERPDRIRDRWAARIANLRDLNLTDAQKAAIADIRKDFRPRVHEAGNKLRGAVKEEVGMILDVIKG